jgi:hypothetical protein
MTRMLGIPIVLKRSGDSTDPNLPAFKFRVLHAHHERQLRAYIEKHCREGVYPLFQECAAETFTTSVAPPPKANW